jgi:hypothetical protein
MAPSASNLIAGPGTLYRADFGATEPLDADVQTEPAAPWVDLGATDDGVTITVSREFFKLRMDQTVDAPGRRMTERDVTLSTNLAEITLENLALSLGQAPDTIEEGAGFSAMNLEGDDTGAEPDYFALLFRGRAPGGFRRHVIGRKMLSTEEVETAYKKGDQTLYPVTFAAHWVSPSIRPVRWVDGKPDTP